MIPLKLHISGFLSYQDPAVVDFDGVELACISGSNGAGKSSILDAITWVLFGQARSRDDEAMINGSPNVKAAEVIFDFDYESNVFRVQRSKARGKTTVLEFFVRSPEGKWMALTEKAVRETEKRLTQTLRMDYDTFVNSSFFLQGRADQFAQQNPSNRKKVLSSVLGLEIWETYRVEASEQRKRQEVELKAFDSQLAEINDELAQGPARKERLQASETRLAQLNSLRTAKEANLDAFRRLAVSLGEQKLMVELLAGRSKETQTRVNRLTAQAAELAETQARLAAQVDAAPQIEAMYTAWKESRRELERWDLAAASFHEIQARRAEPLAQIASARAQLEEERRGLDAGEKANQQNVNRRDKLEGDIPGVKASVSALQEQLGKRAELEVALRVAQQEAADLDAENRRLHIEMDKLKERIKKLKGTEGGSCPFCGQPMNADDWAALIRTLTEEGGQMGDSWRANRTIVEQAAQKQREYQLEITRLSKQEDVLRQQTRLLDQMESELQRVVAALQSWDGDGARRLGEIATRLSQDDFALEARASLMLIDDAARELGYDPRGHDTVRRTELDLRGAEQGLRDLEVARAALAPQERRIAEVSEQLKAESAQLEIQTAEYRTAESKYLTEQAGMPNLDEVERETLTLQAEENRLRMDTGMLRQMVAVLDSQRERKARFEEQKTETSRRISRLRVLERAFGKDGVPALLIEQALPEIEVQANDLLDRLSAGEMSVRFATQRKLKSKDETRETLDIIISDRSGEREYEMFSGGEAFRVNFAIRLALSRVLAHRAGARLQTLFIDEGFGSQDADGRQRLLEAINLVRPEFARILVITHLEEMKDAFPSRIEVEKTGQGSQVRVLR